MLPSLSFVKVILVISDKTESELVASLERGFRVSILQLLTSEWL